MKSKPVSKKSPGFTLMELIVVVIIVAVIAAFAIPNYTRSKLKAHEAEIINSFKLIQAANRLYKARNGQYLATEANGIDEINSLFKLNLLIDPKIILYYDATHLYITPNAQIRLQASYDDGSNSFTVLSNNPQVEDLDLCCEDGDCPTVPDC